MFHAVFVDLTCYDSNEGNSSSSKNGKLCFRIPAIVIDWNFSRVIPSVSYDPSFEFLSSSKSFPASAFMAGLGSCFHVNSPFAISSLLKTLSPFMSQAANTDRAKHSELAPSLSTNRPVFSELRIQCPLLLLEGERSCSIAFPVFGSIL